MSALVNETLAEQMGVDEVEVAERLGMLDFGPKDVEDLTIFSKAAREISTGVIEDFYRHQLTIPEIRRMIGDADTLARLAEHMRRYVARLFSGDYGVSYANSRLRAGRAHARMGVSPRAYVASLYYLKETLNRYLMSSGLIETPPRALEKLFMFDLQFAFDAYVRTLLDHAESVRARPRASMHTGMMLGHRAGMAGPERDAEPPESAPEPMLDEATLDEVMMQAMRALRAQDEAEDRDDALRTA